MNSNFIIKQGKIPIKSWCQNIDNNAMQQALSIANHPTVFHHIALMADCHVGYGVPIGGVIACKNAVIPNAVGVDIGCGMGAIQTNLEASLLKDQNKSIIRKIFQLMKKRTPVGEGHSHPKNQVWKYFDEFLNQLGLSKWDIDSRHAKLPPWIHAKGWDLDARNLGTLGGGNHFIELQESDDGCIWLMLHSGSRNLGYRIASFYHKQAQKFIKKNGINIPNSDLAFLTADIAEGKAYIRDMEFALKYAHENRARMMSVLKEAISNFFPNVQFQQEINIHHNYAALETHFNQQVWVHRKGATSAQKGEKGIIPGSMGTPSFIVEGLGNPESFMSCSHGAGRVLGRMEASRTLSPEDCTRSMEGIVFDHWKKQKRKKLKGLLDLGEAPGAYKNIQEVIDAQLDLIKPIVKLRPLGVIKG